MHNWSGNTYTPRCASGFVIKYESLWINYFELEYTFSEFCFRLFVLLSNAQIDDFLVTVLAS